MAANKRSELQREADLLKMAGLYFQGKSQVDIAKELNITQQQVSYDLKQLQTRWVEAALEKIDAAKGRELAKIDYLERIYFQQWEVSQKLILLPDKTTIEVKDAPGNLRCLEGVQWCIQQRVKIIGLDAPVKNQQSGTITLTVNYADPLPVQVPELVEAPDPAGLLADGIEIVAQSGGDGGQEKGKVDGTTVEIDFA